MSINQAAIFVGYSLLFCASVVAMAWWYRRQRKARLPFGDEMKLLRGPGESQAKLVHAFEEDSLGVLIQVAMIPPFVGGGAVVLASKLPRAYLIPGLVLAAILFVVLFYICAHWYTKRLRENANRHLGYFGERIVAEYLEPLKRQGWYVFHDVPAVANGTRFNLDHVAAGPQGVFAIETKTFRKRSTQDGEPDHKVSFDGRALKWPGGAVDTAPLEQAERNAVWLANTLRDETSERVHVTPIVTLPGWWVETIPSGSARLAKVTNPKGLTKFLPSGPAILSKETLASIAAKLDARCRDVEY